MKIIQKFLFLLFLISLFQGCSPERDNPLDPKAEIYSGTVSAATEGTIYDVPSIAVSIDNLRDTDYSFAASFTKQITRLLLGTDRLPSRTLLNINLPDIPEKKIKGIKLTHQSTVKFKDIFIKRVDPRGRDYYWMDGEYEVITSDEDCDYIAIKNNYISITPIQHDMTDYKRLEYFKGIILNNHDNQK